MEVVSKSVCMLFQSTLEQVLHGFTDLPMEPAATAEQERVVRSVSSQVMSEDIFDLRDRCCFTNELRRL